MRSLFKPVDGTESAAGARRLRGAFGARGARRLILTMLASLCGLACALAGGAAPALAGATRFGSYGSQAGQFKGPMGVAVDAEGNVYVGDIGNHRVDKFDTVGNPLLAWGWGVLGGGEAQTCTNICVAGEYSAEAGAFASPRGVAVDSNPLSLSYGDVYVVDYEHERVEKFDPSGKFLLMFGGHVNKDGANVCVAGEECGKGTDGGTGDGEFTDLFPAHSAIAVGPGGAVYVGDQGRVQVFEASGTWRENISLAAISSTALPSALTVDGAGDVYVTAFGLPGVRELEANGAEKPFQFDPGSESVTALALDPSGDLFVGDYSGGFHVLEYDSAANELASFGSNIVGGNESETHGLAFSQATDELYVPESSCEIIPGEPCIPRASVVVLPAPPPGPLVDSESAAPGLRGAVSFEAVLNAENHETIYHFEYVDQVHYESGGFAGASSTPSAVLGSGFEDHAVSAQATGLVVGETYHYRVVARDSLGHTTYGADQVFQETPAALLEGVSASNVSATSATLSARIGPLGASTSYRWEYGTTSSYGHVYSGNAGEGMEFVALERHLQELQPATTYHYRLVASNEVGSVESPDRTFTTQGAGTEFALLDNRAWELVSPADKKGALIQQTQAPGAIQAALDGASITYFANYDVIGENEAAGKLIPGSQDISVHGPDGWRTQDIALPRNPPRSEEQIIQHNVAIKQYSVFSPDLSQALDTGGDPSTLLAPDALEGTFYWRDNANGSLLPGFTTASVAPGTQLIAGYLGASSDLTHVFVNSPQALTNDAKPSAPDQSGLWSWYEVGGGQIQLVNVMPNGEQSPEDAINFAGAIAQLNTYKPSVSRDGRRVAWTLGESPYPHSPAGLSGYKGLFLRDMVEHKTVRIGGRDPLYQSMSSDGSRVFFLEGGDLHEYDADTGVETDLTAEHGHGAGEASAGVQEAVTDVSEDGSSVYFVAHGVLAQGGVSGEENLYLLRDGAGGWTTRYIATLSVRDEPDWFTLFFDTTDESASGTTRVSPDGRYLTFMSQRPLTGYDNTDAVSGQPDEEVYLYDAVADRLLCASCNPTGARPVGVFTGFGPKGQEKTLVAEGTGWVGGYESRGAARRPGYWLAGSLPSWTSYEYQPRYLSDSGRLFFNSPDALVPADTNGREDVYEYEPAGIGSCTGASSTFSARSGGCVDLVSSGASSAESAFIDAGETGDDAFFMTSSKLTTQDYDTAYDIYDAHVCTVSLPCASAPVFSPPCNSGDSCKAAPSPQPAIFGPAPSATFSGTGNVVEQAKKSAIKHRRKHKARPRHTRHKKRRARRAMRSRNRKASGKVRG